MKRMIAIGAILVLASCASKEGSKKVAPPPTSAATPTQAAKPLIASNSQIISCVNGKETRVLEVVDKGAGCSLAYTKFGKTSSAASSSVGKKHCEESMAKVRGKLEAAGYKCSQGS